MEQSTIRRVGTGIVALVVVWVLAFMPLFQAHAQEDNGGQLTNGDTELTNPTGTEPNENTETTKPVVSYVGVSVEKRANVQGPGWGDWTTGETIGDVNGAGLKAFMLKLTGLQGLDGHVVYRTYKRNAGWKPSVRDGKSTGVTRSVEAVKIKLTGTIATQYDVLYRVYMSKSGWRPWVKNNTMAGLVAKNQRVRAVQVKLVPKTEEAFGKSTKTRGVLYQANVKATGWQAWKHDGSSAGKKAARLSGFAAAVGTGKLTGGIKYRAYSKKNGWADYKSNGAYSYPANKRLEAMKVKLTGTMAKRYDVYYRSYVQGVGWLDWAKNGATSGNTGYGLRLEAFQIKLVAKNGAAPGDTTYTTVNKMEADSFMRGIDIASWQAGIDLAQVDADFVIIKATGGTGYVNPYYAGWADTALESGKQIGFYHYAREASCPGSAVAEANHFIKHVKPYIGKAVLFLDFEAGALEMGNSVKWAKKFMDTVYKKTGVRPLLYTSQSVTYRFDWSSVARKYKLWVAQYLYRNFYTGYLDYPDGGTDIGYWSSPQLYQYSSTGSVSGYDGYLDLNKFYGSVLSWKRLAFKN